MVELDRSYLTTRTTRNDVEKRIDFDSATQEFSDDWSRLVAKMEPGDELWNFEPPPNDIRLWGVALVRDGLVISTLIEGVD